MYVGGRLWAPCWGSDRSGKWRFLEHVHQRVYALHPTTSNYKSTISNYQRKLGSNLPSYGWNESNVGWCVTLQHITMRSVRLYSMNGGVRVDITSRSEVWDYTQWMGVCKFTLHKMRSVRLYSMNGGVRVDITSRWEVWDYTQWMGVCKFTLHKNEKCETILNEWWCESWHHITMRSVRLYSMNGGVRVDITSKWEMWDYTQWMVVWELTSHHDEKCETILNEWGCVSSHYIKMRSVRLYSMNGGV